MSPLNSKDNKIVKTVAKNNEPVTIFISLAFLSVFSIGILLFLINSDE